MNVEYKSNELSDLDYVIEISKKVFTPTAKEILKSHTKEDWLKRMGNDGLLLTLYVENNLAGFAFCYIKEEGTMHIWQVGVLEQYRGHKLWSEMYKKIETYAGAKGFSRITLNTKRSKFPVMYKFAEEHGFNCYKTEMKDGIEKSFFEKNILSPSN